MECETPESIDSKGTKGSDVDGVISNRTAAPMKQPETLMGAGLNPNAKQPHAIRVSVQF
jgi:hypothetical protein